MSKKKKKHKKKEYKDKTRKNKYQFGSKISKGIE